MKLNLNINNIKSNDFKHEMTRAAQDFYILVSNLQSNRRMLNYL